ncbi:MAG: HU family DNA-binding protein [Dissulfurimicrobium sp.]|uniref:HU family DNA-binding protein n=1 Tax=Dissulfurimicrobium TaxID=1769732 RepID=UPI001EDB77B8|nr:HU family DNA-binding protein [Dissulfurimicrobium hydrothermale]UKL13792.1 HU family DNA-binding protein [Dissulfurimicrobium hydrothermale]
MGALTRRDLARRISQEFGFSIRVSRRLIDRLLFEMGLALGNGDRLKIARFGVFCPVERAGRTWVNPIDRRLVEIPPRRGVTFRPSRILKAMVNGEKGEEILPDWGCQQVDRR